VRRVVNTADVAVDLRPLPEQPSRSSEDEEPPPVFESFAQVFRHSPPAALIEVAGSARASPASVLTCWGDGSLHFRRAPADAVREVSGRQTGGALANRLVQLRDKHPEADMASALDQIKLSEPAREALEELLTDESNCHSLWIITRSRDGNVYDLAVLDQSSEEGGRPLVFSW
jgi:hypothetical protein